MDKTRLSKIVKEIRAEKGHSQDELANLSGLSLRTIQRIESGESSPMGDTLKRLAEGLGLSIEELNNWNSDESPKLSIQSGKQYVHIFENKVIFSRYEHKWDINEEYKKSINEINKSVLTLIIFTLLNFIIAVILIMNGKLDLSIYSGGFGLLFFTIAVTQMFFSSNSVIYFKDVVKMKIRITLLATNLNIYHKDGSKLKLRTINVKKENRKSIEKAFEPICPTIKTVNANFWGFEFISAITWLILTVFSLIFLENSFIILGSLLVLMAVINIVVMIKRSF
jgi:transcriptional regulator with XRE-family HTH domain